MNSRGIRYLVPAILTVALLAPSHTTHAARTNAASTVNIGMAAAYTGGTVVYGIPWLRGGQAAAYYINKAGGIMGHKVHLIPVDTLGDPVDAVPAIRKMLAVDNVSAEVGLAALDWTDALPVLNRARMVSFTHIGSPAIDHLHMPYSFSTGPSDAVEGTAMVVYAAMAGYHKVALAFDASPSAQTLVPSVQHAAKALGLHIVADPQLPVGAPSYEAEVLQIVSAKPDAILTQVEPNSAGTFFHELQTLNGASIPVVGSDLTLENDWFNAVGAQEYNAHVVSVEAAQQTSGPTYKSFISGYHAVFHAEPQYLSVYSYDGLTAAALAMVDAKSTNPRVYYKDVLDVTTPGHGHIKVHSFAQGVKLLKRGKKIKYVGVGSPMTYDKYHRVSGPFVAEKNTAKGQLVHIANIPASKIQKVMP